MRPPRRRSSVAACGGARQRGPRGGGHGAGGGKAEGIPCGGIQGSRLRLPSGSGSTEGRPMVRYAVLCLVLLAACEPPPPRPRSVEDFQDEPAVAQGVLARCMANKAAAARDVECENARVANERGAVAEDAKHV